MTWASVVAALRLVYRFRVPLLIAALVASGWAYGCQVIRAAELRGELRAKSAALDSVIALRTGLVAKVDSNSAPVVQSAKEAREDYHRIRLAGPRVVDLEPDAPITVPAITIQTADRAIAALDSALAAQELRIAARDELIRTLQERIELDAQLAAVAHADANRAHWKWLAVGVAVGATATIIATSR